MNPNGKVITVRGPVEPQALGAVLMHEHLHSDIYDWDKGELLTEERPITPERRAFLMKEAVPFLKKCNDHGCFAFVEATPAPWRAWPTFYVEASEAASMHIILCTGFYREVEDGRYWVHKPEDRMWPFVVHSPVEELVDFCMREILEGVHGTEVHAGAIKLGSSGPRLTEVEERAFRAGARAQKATGVHITTHCTKIGAETSQLRLLDREGVNLNRIVVGHTTAHLVDPDTRKVCIEWMRRGANFLPTNLGIREDPERWRPLVEAIHHVFDAGLGDQLCFRPGLGVRLGIRSLRPVHLHSPSALPSYVHPYPACLPRHGVDSPGGEGDHRREPPKDPAGQNLMRSEGRPGCTRETRCPAWKV